MPPAASNFSTAHSVARMPELPGLAEAELTTYRDHLDSLLGDAGKYVVIRGREIIGIYDDFNTAVESTSRFAPEPVLVKQIVETVIVGRDSAKKDRVRISASDESGLFVMRGTQEQIDEAKRIVSEVDKTVVTGLPIRSINFFMSSQTSFLAAGLRRR